MPHMDGERRLGVVPDGVVVSPEAERCLGQALGALRSGLPVAAWMWAQRAASVLDVLTDGNSGDGQVDENRRKQTASAR